MRGIGPYPSIFDTATPDHLMALRQRRAPAAVVEVPVVLVPVSVELAAAALDSRAGIYLRLQSSVPCMMTALGGLNEERLKKVLPLLSDVTTRSETSLPEDNRVSCRPIKATTPYC